MKNISDITEFWLIARREDKLNELANELQKNCKILPLDLSTKKGLTEYLNILKNTPNDYLVVFNVAYLYETLGDYKNAKKYYKMVKKSRAPQISQQATEALDYLKSNKK